MIETLQAKALRLGAIEGDIYVTQCEGQETVTQEETGFYCDHCGVPLEVTSVEEFPATRGRARIATAIKFRHS